LVIHEVEGETSMCENFSLKLLHYFRLFIVLPLIESIFVASKGINDAPIGGFTANSDSDPSDFTFQ
jgi:hypothetical protein